MRQMNCIASIMAIFVYLKETPVSTAAHELLLKMDIVRHVESDVDANGNDVIKKVYPRGYNSLSRHSKKQTKKVTVKQ